MRAVRSLLVVERDVTPDEVLALRRAIVRPQIQLFVLDRSPETLDENVVAPRALAVHADRDPVFLEEVGEESIGELATLIGVEDCWHAELRDRFLDGIDAEVGREAVRAA
jgi:hypothetical protein